MKNLRQRFNRFCFRHRNWGIPNLMLYIVLGSAIVYIMTQISGNAVLYDFLKFDRDLILHGQVWRLISYPLTYGATGGNPLLILISMICYFSLGRAIENAWGTLRFNLFYCCGVVLMDVFCMLFPLMQADVYYLNLSLFLAYATMYPDAQFLLLFIIPVKAWIFALLDLILTLSDVISLSFPVMFFPYNLFPLIAIANYFLFFGKDVANVIPLSWRANFRRLFRRKKSSQQPKVIPFPSAGSYEATVKTPTAPYTHRCTVCGRTDITNPELEFRYCSRCKGYYCYCEEHISNHAHVE